jgi:hypothetical protein
LKAWALLTPEKDMNNCNGGFGSSFWPDQREQEVMEEIIWLEVCACEGTFRPDHKVTPAFIKRVGVIYKNINMQARKFKPTNQNQK